MLESRGRQSEGERGRRWLERNRVKESGKRGGWERHRNIRTHRRVKKEVGRRDWGARRKTEGNPCLIGSLATLKVGSV